jgi:hypothetical protein
MMMTISVIAAMHLPLLLLPSDTVLRCRKVPPPCTRQLAAGI